MQKTLRWFGSKDPVKLSDLKQMDIEGVVTSLHDIPPGEKWPGEKIRQVKNNIENEGLQWSVVESLPVAEGIKVHSSDYDRLIQNYITSLTDLAEAGIKTVCYNFMPAIDWIRTGLHHQLPNGGEVMLFDYHKFIAFDIFILKRPDAGNDYPADEIAAALKLYETLTDDEAEELAFNIIVRTQGFIHGTITSDNPDYKKLFLEKLAVYESMDKETLHQNLQRFLDDVIPVATKLGINMCIHPDDPPFPLLGLPRIVSTADDLNRIFSSHQSLSHGLTFCSGSLSPAKENNLADIFSRFAERVHFLHLRNNTLTERDFLESGHIDGDVDLPGLIWLVLKEQQRRKKEGREDFNIPVRPDHGIKVLDDFKRDSPPGYPLIGRFAGLKEIRGIEVAMEYMLNKHGSLLSGISQR